MRLRSCVAVLGISALVAAAAPGFSQVDAARRGSGLRVKKLVLKPTRLAASGGLVFLAVRVTKRGSKIARVRAGARSAGGAAGPLVVLARQGSTSRYQGEVMVPANLRTTATRAVITVYVTLEGQSTEKAVPLSTVTLAPGSDSLPPPPPD